MIIHTSITQDLTPQQAEAVRYYTDPLLPTFSNKTQAALAAGYNNTRVFETEAVRQAIARITEERASAGREVAEYMATYVIDAARALVENLHLGKSLTVEDPQELLGPPTEEEVRTAEEMFDAQCFPEKGLPAHATVQDALGALVDGRLRRADAITKANRVALQAAKETREAAEIILRYHMGDPSNRPRDDEELPLDLSDLSPEELLGLGDTINEMIERQKAQTNEPVEAEWQEENSE